MNEKRYRVRDEIAWRKMKDGTVTIVSPLVEKIISINATAGMIWELFDGMRTVATVVDELYRKYDDGTVDRETIARDVQELIGDLTERMLIEEVDNNSR